MNNLEYLKDVNEQFLASIRFADTKAEVLLAIVGLFGGLLGFTYPRMLEATATTETLAQAVLVTMTMCAISTIVAMHGALTALAPRLSGARESLRSFPDAARIAADEYIARLLALGPDGIRGDLAYHNAILCRIAEKKFHALANTVRALKMMLISSAGVCLLYALAQF